MDRWLKNILAFGIIAGPIIGVGFFSLPYIAAKVGLPIMLVFFVVLFIFALAEHLIFTEVAINTPDYIRFPGFAKYYLGKGGEIFSFFTTLFTSFFALLAYVLVGGSFLKEILYPVFDGPSWTYHAVFFILGAIFIYVGVKLVSRLALLTIVAFATIFVAIATRAWPFFNIANLSVKTGTPVDLLLPYGAIVFAIWGLGLIPEAEEILREYKKDLRFVVPLALLAPFIIYVVFTILVLGISGSTVSESALIGLGAYLGPSIYVLALVLGIMCTFNSFVCMGMTLHKVLNYDLKLERNLSWFLACFVPIALYFLGFKDFIPIVSIVGGFAMGIEGMLILAMYKKIKPQSKIIYPMGLVFVLGIIIEIIIVFKII